MMHYKDNVYPIRVAYVLQISLLANIVYIVSVYHMYILDIYQTFEITKFVILEWFNTSK